MLGGSPASPTEGPRGVCVCLYVCLCESVHVCVSEGVCTCGGGGLATQVSLSGRSARGHCCPGAQNHKNAHPAGFVATVLWGARSQSDRN